MRPKVIADFICLTAGGMISGQGEQQKVKLYKPFHSTDEQGRITDWFVGCVPNEADFVYCRQQGNFRSEGFGGARMTFPIEGGSVDLQGPWHGNADALYRATGYDCRDKHYTQCVIGLEYTSEYYSARKVIYVDPEPVLSCYMRPEWLIHKLSEKYDNITLYGWMKSSGGGSSLTSNHEMHPMVMDEIDLLEKLPIPDLEVE